VEGVHGGGRRDSDGNADFGAALDFAIAVVFYDPCLRGYRCARRRRAELELSRINKDDAKVANQKSERRRLDAQPLHHPATRHQKR